MGGGGHKPKVQCFDQMLRPPKSQMLRTPIFRGSRRKLGRVVRVSLSERDSHWAVRLESCPSALSSRIELLSEMTSKCKTQKPLGSHSIHDLSVDAWHRHRRRRMPHHEAIQQRMPTRTFVCSPCHLLCLYIYSKADPRQLCCHRSTLRPAIATRSSCKRRLPLAQLMRHPHARADEGCVQEGQRGVATIIQLIEDRLY